MITVIATSPEKEEDEFGPFLYCELNHDGLRCETEDRQFVEFFFHSNMWYPRKTDVELVGDTLSFINKGEPPPNVQWITTGPDLTHHGWTDLLIIEDEEEDEDG